MSISSQNFESYVPLYDTVPDKWEDARPFLVEQLRRISNAVNVREIGWLLDEELLAGKFLYSLTDTQQFRSVLRKVINCSPLVVGVNTFAHGIVFDSNFTLVQLFGAATNSVTFVAEPLPNGSDTITMNATNIIITVASAYDRCNVVIEYTQEV